MSLLSFVLGIFRKKFVQKRKNITNRISAGYVFLQMGIRKVYLLIKHENLYQKFVFQLIKLLNLLIGVSLIYFLKSFKSISDNISNILFIDLL